MAEKEREFLETKCSVFREVVIYLVLVYEKTLEDHFMEAIGDIQHCYTLLGNSETLISIDETSDENLDTKLVKGNYLLNEIKCKRANPCHEGAMFYDEDNIMLNVLKPEKGNARRQCRSSDAELLVHHSKVQMSDQAASQDIVADSCVPVSGRNDINMGSFDANMKCVGHNGGKNHVVYHTSYSINCKENLCNPELINAVLISDETEEENVEKLKNLELQADIIQESDRIAIRGSEKEKPAGEESETERQRQRQAALEYVVNATLAHLAYFSGSHQEAYKLAKFIKHE